MTNEKPVLELKNIRKRFGALEVLKGVSLEIYRGEVIVIIGPSGSGKSTLLRCANLLDPPTSGDVYFDAVKLTDKKLNINKYRQKIGMVFQHFNLFPNMSVLGNLTIAPMKLQNKTKEEAEQKAMSLLERVGLKHKSDAYPSQLSGGQKQRVAIARALCMDPDLMLFDEPTSSLDPEMISEVTDVMKELSAAKTTMFVVTHEMGFAKEAAHRVAFIDEGLIVEINAPQEMFNNSTNPRIRAFLSKVSG